MEKIITLIGMVQRDYPHLNIGQIITRAANLGGWGSYEVWYCPDEILEAGLQIMYERANPIIPMSEQE